MIYERTYNLPQLVKTLTFEFGGWIVGSGAKYLVGEIESVNQGDWDVVISPTRWPDVAHIVPKGTPANNWGGFKLDGVDFWSEDLGHFFNSVNLERCGYPVAVHPKTLRTVKMVPPTVTVNIDPIDLSQHYFQNMLDKS